MSPEATAARARALDHCAVIMDLVMRGRLAAMAGDLNECDKLAREAHDFTTGLDNYDAASVIFELTEQLVSEMAAVHGGLESLRDAFMKEEPVFVTEKGSIDDVQT